MDDLFIARGFWGPRPESPERIADTLVAFLTDLDGVVGETLQWSSHRLPGASLTEPDHARQVLTAAFRENTDAPHLGVNQAYDAHGTRVGPAGITMGVGGFSDSPKVHNAFLVKWGGAEPTSLADPILRRLIAAWDPDWAAVTSRSLIRVLADLQPAGSPGPKVGYLTYLSEGRARAVPSGLDEHVRRLDNGGVIVGSGDDFLSADRLRGLAMDRRLDAAFGPTPTSRSKV